LHLLRSPPPPRAPLFPYTTLFRSSNRTRRAVCGGSRWSPPVCLFTRSGGACMRVIDFHNHYYPPRYLGVLQSGASSVRVTIDGRSEEHTSELQSRSDIVCRLLLEK